MKTKMIYLSFISILLFTSCNKDEQPIMKSPENKVFGIFGEESRESLKSFFGDIVQEVKISSIDIEDDYIDSERINQIAFRLSPISFTRTYDSFLYPSIAEIRQIFRENLSENAFSIFEQLLNLPELSFEKLLDIKAEAVCLNKNEKELIEYIIESSLIVYEEIMINTFDINTRASGGAPSTLACNLAHATAFSAAGWVWGAAIGGPVGGAVGWAISTIGGTVAAYYGC